MPMRRLSRQAVDAILGARARSWGYCEVFFPTLLQDRGMVTAEIPAKALGAYRYRAAAAEAMAAAGAADNRFYHPVKT